MRCYFHLKKSTQPYISCSKCYVFCQLQKQQCACEIFFVVSHKYELEQKQRKKRNQIYIYIQCMPKIVTGRRQRQRPRQFGRHCRRKRRPKSHTSVFVTQEQKVIVTTGREQLFVFMLLAAPEWIKCYNLSIARRKDSLMNPEIDVGSVTRTCSMQK